MMGKARKVFRIICGVDNSVSSSGTLSLSLFLSFLSSTLSIGSALMSRRTEGANDDDDMAF